MAKKKGMTFKALANGSAELHIDGEIGGWGIYASELRREIKSMGEINALTVYLNSPGGSVIEGLNIYNLLKRLKADISIVITGLAASMGSVIAMAGTSISMAEGTLMMIHNPWGGAVGDANELRKVADILDKMKNSLIGTYHAKTNIERDEIAQLMNNETWMDTAEAKELGFIDAIEDEVDAENIVSIDEAKALVATVTKNEQQEIAASVRASNSLEWIENKDFSGSVSIRMNRRKQPAPIPTGEVTSSSISAEQPVLMDAINTPEGRNPPITKTEDSIMDELEKQKAALKARNNKITKLFAKHTQLGDLKAECLADIELTIEDVQAKMLDALGASRDNTPVGGVTVIEDARDKMFTGMSKAILAKSHLEADDTANEFRSYTMVEMARAILRNHGVAPAGDKMGMIASAMTHSSGDFGNLLSNVANKAMLKGVEEADETFQLWTGVDSFSDFKENTRVDIGDFSSLRQVKEGAEYKSVTLDDSSASAVLATYGELFTITRQAIINDDLGAFTRIPRKFGRAAVRTVGDLVYAQLVLSSHYSTANEITGSDLTATNLDILRAKQATRKVNGINKGTRAKFLLVPVALEGTAKQEMKREKIDDSGTPNPVLGAYDVVADYRLDDHNAKRYFTVADPNMYDAMDVCYLDGNATPTLEQQQGWHIDGASFKVRHDAAAKLWDSKTVARGTGS
jgi:ATP-dependent Clp endopeptidase proteolytic subunit ClpP